MKEEIKINQNFIDDWEREDIFKKTLKDIKPITPADKNQLETIKMFFNKMGIPMLEEAKKSIIKRKALLKELEDMFLKMGKEFDILQKEIDKKDKELNNGK